ncbi:hypothetical protein D3C75_1304630 [compost metagenome]
MLVADHVAGDQHQANDETVVAGNVIGAGPGAAEHQHQVGTVAAIQGHGVYAEHTIEVSCQNRAARRGSNDLVA